MTSAEDRIIALEEHARVTSQALCMAVALVRALAISNGALFALLDASTRETMRAAARPVIGDGDDDAQARAMLEALLREPDPAGLGGLAMGEHGPLQ